MEWISVEMYGSPKTRHKKPLECMVSCANGVVASAVFDLYPNSFYVRLSEEKHITTAHNEACGEWRVTHWMPLPAPPTQTTKSSDNPDSERE